MRSAVLAGLHVDTYRAPAVLGLHAIRTGVDDTGVGVGGEYGAASAGVAPAITFVPPRDREVQQIDFRWRQDVFTHRTGSHFVRRVVGRGGRPVVRAAAQRLDQR